MKKIFYCFLTLTVVSVLSCTNKQDNRDVAINLVKAEYGDVRLNFDSAKLDSLYNISPSAYADSMNTGRELDVQLANLESQIEHLPQSASDSVGRVSAELTKQRYRLLELRKTKPEFIGWTLSNVEVIGKESKVLDFKLDTAVTKILK